MSDTSNNSPVAFSVAACLLSFVIAVAPSLQKISWWWPWSSEARLSTMLGLGTGAAVLIAHRVMHLKTPALATEESQTFFFDVLLPFVIFNAGFSFKKVVFFANSGMILCFGILGTFVSFAIISAGVAIMIDWFNFQDDYVGTITLADILRVGAVLAATDTVAILTVINQERHPLLYSLAFGEGVVNDAVAVVIVRVISDHETNLDLNAVQIMQLMWITLKLFVGSVVLGVLFGLLTAFLVRNISDDTRHSAYEVSLIIVVAFMAYYFALLADMSGITTIFICGIMDSHYAWHSLDDVGKIASKQFALMMSNGCEIIMFIITGLHSMDPVLWRAVNTFHVCMLSVWMLILVVISRALIIFPFSNLSNTWRGRELQLNHSNQCALAWGGLLRGSVSMALAYHEFKNEAIPPGSHAPGAAHPDGEGQHNIRSVFLASILVVVQFTIIVFGVLSTPTIDRLLDGDDTRREVQNFKASMLNIGADRSSTAPQQLKTMDVQFGEAAPLVGRRSSGGYYGGYMGEHGGPEGGDEVGGDVRGYSTGAGGYGASATAAREPERRRFGVIHMGRAFIQFDRKYMQPVFGGRYAPDRIRQDHPSYAEIREAEAGSL